MKMTAEEEIAALKADKADILAALKLINAHYDDICNSNPGFMGKLCLQDYGLWNRALITSERVLAKFAN